MRISGVLMAAAMLAGCGGEGGFREPNPAFGSGGSGIRWSGPAGTDPFAGSPFGFGGSPFGRGMGSGGGDRTFQPSPGVVCDRGTETCYRGRDIDASETRDYFGKGAARQVDRIRDQAGTNRIYRASDDVVCNRLEKVCYKNGNPDRSETRDYFGKKAARRVD
jgi:hypothetical protein